MTASSDAVSVEAPPHVRLDRWRVLAVLLAAQTLVTLDGATVSVAAPAIREGLGATGGELQLIVSAAFFGLGVVLVTGARLGSDHGHRRLFLIGLAIFTGAALASAAAPTAEWLIASRLLQGVGGALMLPQVLTTIQLYFDGQDRARAIGYYSLVLSVGVFVGQILGGAIVSLDPLGLGWRAVFAVSVTVGAVTLGLAHRALPLDAGGSGKRLDAPGVALLATAMAALLIPLALGREAGWPPWALATVAVGMAGLVAFGLLEVELARRGRDPLFDLAVLMRPGVKPALAAICIVMGCYAALLFAIVLHLQEAMRYSPLEAGATFAFYAAGFGAASMTWPRSSARVRSALPLVGVVGFAVASAATALAAGDGWSLLTLPFLSLAGACHALGFSPLVEEVSVRIHPRHVSEYSGIMSTGPILASAVGVATLGGVYLAAASSGKAEDSVLGLQHVAVALVVLMVVAAVCVARVMRLPRLAEPNQPGG